MVVIGSSSNSLAQGEEETNSLIWTIVKSQEDGMLRDGRLSLLEFYLHFVQSFILIFIPTIKIMESVAVTVADVFPALFQVRNELENPRNDKFLLDLEGIIICRN